MTQRCGTLGPATIRLTRGGGFVNGNPRCERPAAHPPNRHAGEGWIWAPGVFWLKTGARRPFADGLT